MPELEDLKLSEERAVAIIEKGIEYEAYGDEQDETPEVPKSKKERLEAADEIIALCVDAFVNDGITPDDEDPDVAEEGRRIEEIIGLAGIEIDDDGNIVYGDMPDLDNGGDEAESDEAPFNPDDYIEGYSELSAVSKLKAVKKLDIDSDDDVAILEAIYDWENEQDKPSSRVLHYVDEALPEEDEPEVEEPEVDEPEDEDEPEAEADEDEQPWPANGKPGDDDYMKGYDESSAVEIKKLLAGEMEAGDLTREQVEYVLDYEEGRDKPRKRVVDYCNALLQDFDNGGDDEPEDEPEPAPKRGRGRPKKAVQSEPKPAAPPESSNGVIVLTREQILTALTDGEVEIAV